ncbi:MAG: hypothetical protein ACK4YP_05290 [Myxococcota bacterium]
MGWTLLLLAACGAPDPDALLHKGDLDGATVAYAERAGAPLDVEHPVAEILAGRARSDATVTTGAIADAMDAVRFLEQAPIIRTQGLDLTFDRFEDLGAALDVLAEGDALLVVGRSEGLGDKDPYLMGGALPWKGGRVVGWARRDMKAFGKSIDANPPPKVLVVGVRDATGAVYVNVERRDGVWAALSSSDAKAAARLVLAADAVRDYTGPALRTREGGGFVRR